MQTNLLVLGVLTVLAVALIVYSILPRKAQERETVKRRLSGLRGADLAKPAPAETRPGEARTGRHGRRDATRRTRESPASELVRRAAPVLSKLALTPSEEAQTNLRMKLANAGYRQPQAQTLFLASKSVLAVVGLFCGVACGLAAHLQLLSLVGLACLSAGVGLMLPEFWLSLAISSRKQKIRHGLPDTLDLLVVSVEAGLALDAALKRVGEEMIAVHPELSQELRITTMETQMGLRRNEALENLARRTGLDEVRSLVSVLIQAEKFGTSIAKALRNQADSLRIKRRQTAEEKAQKTAVKLMIPLVLFIFPAIAVVVAGPAAISALRAWQTNAALGGG